MNLPLKRKNIENENIFKNKNMQIKNLLLRIMNFPDPLFTVKVNNVVLTMRSDIRGNDSGIILSILDTHAQFFVKLFVCTSLRNKLG